ncbi:hypothetical protein BigBertha_217 [Bacillus phage BigBertha]|uniref:Membrane protein n=3 Tax=Bequatrovirus TaxID=1917990 RepID=A0A7U3T8V8_9CAUD|nr:hypothetical protein BigBertha_217 [Bacillus phage BigBertha]YP_009290094.1 hypothetical protein BI003_gp215 [Bacillus phage Phrodo]AMW61596.1 hypothetical protein JUGLONE_220 [Bacillus phage Juglone]QPY77448.1 membrane protein [Bacillus phage Anthos]ULF48842.1 membrane protein [Bacillus phage BillyBob]AGY46725.1 hypothetical protein BigBertha_217 [Bacillus phage BigBertha]AMW62256.1 hypothetical protein PHRODO_215 [Bacillus phage Phrodo]
MGIAAVSAGIALVCTTGLALSTVFKFLHSFEMEVGVKKEKRNRRDANEERFDNMANRSRLNK